MVAFRIVSNNDVESRPICSETLPGNTTDAKTLLPVIERVRAKFRVRELCVVTDRGMVRGAAVCREAFRWLQKPMC